MIELNAEVNVIRRGNPQRVTVGKIVARHNDGTVTIDENGVRFLAEAITIFQQIPRLGD